MRVHRAIASCHDGSLLLTQWESEHIHIHERCCSESNCTRGDRKPLDCIPTHQRLHTSHRLPTKNKTRDQSAEQQRFSRIVSNRAAVQRDLRSDGRGTVRQRHNKRTPGRRLDAGMNSHRAVTAGDLRTNYSPQANAEVRHAGNCRYAAVASSRLLHRDIR